MRARAEQAGGVGSPPRYCMCPSSHAPAKAQFILRQQSTTTAGKLLVCEKSWKRRGPGNGAFLWSAVVLESPGVGTFGRFREHDRQVKKRNQIKAKWRYFACEKALILLARRKQSAGVGSPPVCVCVYARGSGQRHHQLCRNAAHAITQKFESFYFCGVCR